ncbi:enoyl-CoA hydratase/isomerase family protein [Maritimibacter sp. 55A14]|uniref:enoyl-CoA hydratase/isomerase family protein n=1 Tax=Maritimibacter sp. 55A14 TaxID=2174844 RepID=UPI000D60A0AA|nr:enoyl-CoA hydratase/isomerase family protein [Maritimibacter sp. 55A14]PWE33232.1 enoyl-CoA hydratase/isomerase family protein [Maritimibacter sp. 55A14]
MSDFRYATVLSARDGGVRTITLNRPESLNAMNRALIDDLARAVEDANADPATRAILLTGAGRAFCAGDDRREHIHPESEEAARALVDAIQRVTRAMVLGPKPIVGAINGWAVGGGFEWAINCDFPLWAESARGFFPEVSLNLFVTGAVTTLLPALTGLAKAREMLFFGRKYGARELAEAGVAWRVVPDDLLMAEARAVAGELAGLPPLSVRAMKRVLHAAALPDIGRAMALETDATVAGFLDPETTRRLSEF